MATYETKREGTRSVMEENLDSIRGYEIMRDAVIQIVKDNDTIADELKEFVARFSEIGRLPCFSSRQASLSRPARPESGEEPCGRAALVSINSNHEFVLEVLEEKNNSLYCSNDTAVSSNKYIRYTK